VNFSDKLVNKIKERKNPSVIGLDPRIEQIPSFIRKRAFDTYGETAKGAAEALLEFNKGIIDAVYDLVPAVKPQLAFYEIYGHEGMRVLGETVRYAKGKGLLVICDGKRNDIGSSAEAYSRAYIGKNEIGGTDYSMEADALTVNPFFGLDGIAPFIDDCKRNDTGVFILVKTSNPTSAQIQDLVTSNGKRVYEIIARMVHELGEDLIGGSGYSSIGAVVGATHPEQAKVLRKIMPHAYILVPGYGAQGGTASGAAASFNDDGLGAIVNASRSVIFAYRSKEYAGRYSEEQYQDAARAETIRMRDDITGCLRSASI
jgi:orotidine-5'-phosphate decarboxylase